jgi:hypothetical protein
VIRIDAPGNSLPPNSGFAGAKCGWNGNSSVFNLMILNENIISTNFGYGGSGIGSGDDDHGNSRGFNGTILNGNTGCSETN